MVPAVGFQPELQPETTQATRSWLFRHNLYGIQIPSLSLNLLHVHRMNIRAVVCGFVWRSIVWMTEG